MILSNVLVQDALDSGRLVIDPQPVPRRPTELEPECPYQTSAVDLRLSDEISVYTDAQQPVQIDLRRGGFSHFALSAMRTIKITKDQPFSLIPGRFVLASTHERVALPLHAKDDLSLAARVEGRSSYARCGLLVHFTAPTIHAGFSGTITLEIINLGKYPIALYPEMAICQLIIEEVRGLPFHNDSQFQGQRRAIGSV
jgi:dCTP deaminase